MLKLGIHPLVITKHVYITSYVCMGQLCAKNVLKCRAVHVNGWFEFFKVFLPIFFVQVTAGLWFCMYNPSACS